MVDHRWTGSPKPSGNPSNSPTCTGPRSFAPVRTAIAHYIRNYSGLVYSLVDSLYLVYLVVEVGCDSESGPPAYLEPTVKCCKNSSRVAKVPVEKPCGVSRTN